MLKPGSKWCSTCCCSPFLPVCLKTSAVKTHEKLQVVDSSPNHSESGGETSGWIDGFEPWERMNLGTLRIYNCMTNCYSWKSFRFKTYPKTSIQIKLHHMCGLWRLKPSSTVSQCRTEYVCLSCSLSVNQLERFLVQRMCPMALWLFSVFLQYHPNPSPMRPKRRILSRKIWCLWKRTPWEKPSLAQKIHWRVFEKTQNANLGAKISVSYWWISALHDLVKNKPMFCNGKGGHLHSTAVSYLGKPCQMNQMSCWIVRDKAHVCQVDISKQHMSYILRIPCHERDGVISQHLLSPTQTLTTWHSAWSFWHWNFSPFRV